MNISRQVQWAALAAVLLGANATSAAPIGDPTDDPYFNCVEQSRATFTATPAAIDRGASTTLQWSVFPATGCSWMKNVLINGRTLGLVGSLAVQPSITQNYTLQIPVPARPGQAIGMTTTRVVVHFPGALDTTFSGSGQVIEIASGLGLSTASYSDARSLLAGVTPESGVRKFFIKRLSKTGLPDPTFGSGGKVLIDFPGYTAMRTQVVLLPDQKILLGGTVCIQNNDPFHPQCEVVATRLLPSGQFDPTFGFGGKSIITVSDLRDSGWLSTVVGDAVDGGTLIATDRVVVRFRADGGVDTTFGQQGRVLFGLSKVPTFISAIALQVSGKIVVAGADQTLGGSRMGLARLNRNGSPDTTFGSGGSVSQGLALNGIAGTTLVMAMTLQTDDRIIVGGMGTVPTVFNAALLRRFSKDGALDTSFEGQALGLQLPDLWWVMALAVQPNNQILVAGGFGPSTAAPSFAVRRLSANGAPDTTYGSNGRTTVAGGFFTAQLQVQNHGCLMLAGTRRPTLTSIQQPALLRFEGDLPALPGQYGTSHCFRDELVIGTSLPTVTLTVR